MQLFISRKAFPLALLALSLAASCKKEPADEPADPNATPATVPVLRDGAGFNQYATKMINVGTGIGTASDNSGFHDFSIDKATAELHLIYWVGWQSQQDYLKNAKRAVFNLNSNTEVALADDAIPGIYSNNGFTTTVLEYLPYTSKYAVFKTTGQRTGFYSQARWGGSVTGAALPMAPSTYGYTGGVGFYNMYTDWGTEKHYMTVNPNPTSTTALMHINIEYRTPPMAMGLANFPEPRYNGQGKSAVITVCKDSVLAYTIDYGQGGVMAKTGSLTPSGYTTGQQYTTQRRYTPDGTLMTMLVRGETTKRYWTYTYNCSTGALAAVLSDVELPYAADGSDIDMDEAGNIYYTGKSGAGSGAGVSVYKHSAGGSTLVGTDDFLKFGTVVKLKHLDGKVHLAVMGSVTNHAGWAQLCMISLK